MEVKAAAKAALPQLQQIEQLLASAHQIWRELDPETQQALIEHHNETGSIAHCLRWGERAAEELISVAAS